MQTRNYRSSLRWAEWRSMRPVWISLCRTVLLVLLALCALPTHAQYSASLQGTVADPQGAMIPGAHLILKDLETGQTWSATSDATGTFTFNALPPAVFELTVTRDGFATKAVEDVHILAEQANSLNVQLAVGAKSQTVTVNASKTPLIDTATGDVSGTISQQDLARMPDFGRDPLQMLMLAPGMMGDDSQSAGGGTYSLPGNDGDGSASATSGPYMTENKPQVFGNGQRNDTNGITLDGIGITSVTWGSAAVVTPNPDAIAEIKVSSNEYDAEYGRFGGAQVQLITQNGTNHFHGTALFKFDRPGLNAYQRWDPNNNPQRDNARYDEFGGTLGGPIWRDKVFFFFSYDSIRNTGTATGGGWYETSAFDKSAPSGSIAGKFLGITGAGAVYTKILEDPADGHNCANINLVQGVNCNYIQGQGLDIGRPLTIGLGKQDPSYAPPTSNGVYTPGLGGDGTGSYSNLDGVADLMYVATTGPNNNINTQYGGRLDYQITAKDRIAGTVFYVPVNNTDYNGPYRASNLFHHNALNYATGLIYDRTFTPTLLNEARVGMAGWKWNELTDNPQSPLGLPDVTIAQNNCNGPSFSSTYEPFSYCGSLFGPSVGSVFDQWTLNFKDVVTKVQGSHNIRMGGEVTRLAYLDEPTWEAEPTYFFSNLWDFLNDAPNGENVTADPRTGQPSLFRKDDRQNYFAFFGQDDWKMRPNLTVNLGLRWEYYGGMTEKKGNEPNVRLGSGSSTLTGLNVVLGGTQVNAPKTNFGPEIGFAWSPTRMRNNLVIRGGFGIGYTGLEEAITTNTRFNPPFVANGENLTGSEIVYGTASNVYQAGALPANPNLITSFNSANLPTNGLPTPVTALPTNLATATTYHYSVEGQYLVGHGWVATVGYTGAAGRNLPLQTNLNNYYASQILAGQMAFNPIVNGIDWYYDSGNSTFNSLLLEGRHQFANTFEADVQYVFGKSTDDGSGPYSTSDYEFLPGYNNGPSDYDVRQDLKMFANWSPLLFRGSRSWLEKVAGGWNISPIFNIHSGFPYDVVYGNGIANNAFYGGSSNNGGNGSLRPASYKGGAGTSQSTDSFKSGSTHFPGGGSAFFSAPTVPAGNSWSTDVAPTPVALPTPPGISRNAFRGPRYSDLDMAMTKSFGLPNVQGLGENARFEIRADAFNLFNKLNLAGVDNTVTDSTFGRANTVLGSRTVELEAHFKF